MATKIDNVYPNLSKNFLSLLLRSFDAKGSELNQSMYNEDNPQLGDIVFMLSLTPIVVISEPLFLRSSISLMIIRVLF